MQTHAIDKGLLKKALGDNIAVSPVVTIEPRHRKFHQPITITIPIPESEAGSRDRHVGAGSPTLRLLCSLVGWSDKWHMKFNVYSFCFYRNILININHDLAVVVK